MTNKQAVKKLKKWSDDYNRTGLELAVINDLLNEDEDYIISHMKDVLNHGCVSGCVSGLIYYKDTYEFFDEHYNDIMDLIAEYADEGLGFDIMADFNVKNTGAWFAYEETVRRLLNELEIEY